MIWNTETNIWEQVYSAMVKVHIKHTPKLGLISGTTKFSKHFQSGSGISQEEPGYLSIPCIPGSKEVKVDPWIELKSKRGASCIFWGDPLLNQSPKQQK